MWFPDPEYIFIMGFSRAQLGEIREIIQETIAQLVNDKTFIANLALKISEDFDNRCKHYEKQIADLKEGNKCLHDKLEAIEQHSRKNNVRIYGLDESGQREGEDIIQMLCRETNLNFAGENIESVFRVGRATQAGHRAILLRFKGQQYKDEIMSNRRRLKGTKIVICDDLTKSKHAILKEAVDRLGKKNVYCLGGKIYYKKGSCKCILNTLEDLRRFTSE